MKYVKRIVAAMLCLVLVMALASCAAGGGEEDPKTAVTATLDALKEGKLLTVKRNVEWADMDLLQSGMKKMKKSSELVDAMFGKLSYTIKEEPKINGDIATVRVAITTKNIQTTLTSFMFGSFLGALTNKQTLDDKYINEQIPKVIESLNSADIKMETYDVTVNVKKVKNKWKVEVDPGLENAIFGGGATIVKYFMRTASGKTAQTTTKSSTTAAKTTAAGPKTTLSKEQRDKASEVQSSMLANLASALAKNKGEKTTAKAS